MIKKIENQFNNKRFPLWVFGFFFIFSVMISLGHVDRWILAEQIAMAENYLTNKSFYPLTNQENITGVSVYPPGLAIFSLLFLEIGFGTYIFEILLVISILFLILYFFIQKRLFEEVFNLSITSNEIMLYIILVTTLLPRWYDYSLQLKPSIIAQVIGFSILYCFLKLKSNKNILIPLLLGVLFSIPIIFKQQYISFIIGFIFYSLFKRNLKNLLFSIGSVISLFSIVFIPDFEGIRFWTYEILRDDGVTPLLIIFSEHYLVFLRFFFFLGFCIFIGVNFKNQKEYSIKFLFNKVIENPLFSIIFFSFFAVYLGLYKAGGNDGNIDGGILFLTPFIFLIFKKIEFKYLVFFSFISVFSLLPKAYISVEEYISMVEFKNNIEKINIVKNMKLVTDSNSYYASRVITNKEELDNFHTYSLTMPGRGSPNLEIYFEDKLSNIDFVLFIEQTKKNRVIIENLNLQVIYENNSGIIASNAKGID